MTLSRFFGKKAPQKGHLLTHGMSAEVTDLRKDVEEAFETLDVSLPFLAKGVIWIENINLASCPIALDDGFSLATGDAVLLAGQTTATQNGLYLVGKVTGSNCALSRHPTWTAGSVIPAGAEVLITNGIFFAGTRWRNFAAPATDGRPGAVTVDTTAANFYPRRTTVVGNFVAGVLAISFMPIANWAQNTNAGTSITVTSRLPVGSAVAALTARYSITAVTPGPGVSATATISALKSDGTLNTADTSPASVLIENG